MSNIFCGVNYKHILKKSNDKKYIIHSLKIYNLVPSSIYMSNILCSVKI